MIFVRRELIRRSVVVVFPLFSHTFCFVVYQYERLLFSLLLQSSLDYLRRLACHVMEKTVSTKWYYIIPLIFSKNTKEPKAPNHKSLKITKSLLFCVILCRKYLPSRCEALEKSLQSQWAHFSGQTFQSGNSISLIGSYSYLQCSSFLVVVH